MQEHGHEDFRDEKHFLINNKIRDVKVKNYILQKKIYFKVI